MKTMKTKTITTRKSVRQKMIIERERLLNAYRMLANSIREARSLQTVLEKERQMRRLMHLMKMGRTGQPQR